MPFQIKFTRAALKDLLWLKLTDAEVDALEAAVRRIARLHDVRYDQMVMEVAQTDGEWLRLKIVQPSQMRAFFTVDEDAGHLVVRLVLRRTERTYDMAQIIWRAQKARI